MPGVSGGTIALILGIYEALIGHIALVLAPVRNPGRRQAWLDAGRALKFLLPLVAGMGIALVSALRLLVGYKPKPEDFASLEAYRLALQDLDGLLVNAGTAPYVFGLFFGLVLTSIPEPWRRITHPSLRHWLWGLAGAVASAAVALLPNAAGSTHPAMLILAGAIAISVMLLPGISGSLALLVIGMYQPISHAVNSFDLRILPWVGAGMLGGLLLFIPLLRRLLRTWHDNLMALLAGLMAGSLAALWPWKTHYLPDAGEILGPMNPIAPTGSPWLVIGMILLGAAIVPLGNRLAARRPTPAEPA